MRKHQRGSESGRTVARRPPAPTDLSAFDAHWEGLVAFTDALLEGRCRRTDHFEARLGETMAAFRPLFAPWNMEVLFVLHVQGPRRFNALKRALGDVSSRVLTDKLRHLERHGLVRRVPQDDGATAYALDARGAVVARHLHPLLFYLHNESALRPRSTRVP